MRVDKNIGLFCLVALLAGCGAVGSTSQSVETAGSGGLGETGWTSWGASSSTGDASGGSTTTTGPPPEPSNFLDEEDVYQSMYVECSFWAEDCPLGQKCMAWARDGGNSWNAWKCSPIDPEPDAPGEPCVAYDSQTSGLDSCDLHSMCWKVDRETLEGTCVSFCEGGWSNPHCTDPEMTCSVGGDLALCMPMCHPLAQDCPEGEACYGIDQIFVCAPDVSGDMGTLGDPCEFINACDPGFECTNADGVPGCEGSAGCCSPHCDLDEPDPCVAGQQCIPWFEDGAARPGYEDIGICFIPEG